MSLQFFLPAPRWCPISSFQKRAPFRAPIFYELYESITNYISELEKTNNNQSTVNIDELIKKNIESYKNDITNNTLKYFVSENGKLNIIIKLYTPQEIEPIETIIEIS